MSDEISGTQRSKIIVDLFSISYPYLRRPTHVKPKPKEVRHENSICRQNLDGLSPVALKKHQTILRVGNHAILPGPWE
jgi:hypothetical protein